MFQPGNDGHGDSSKTPMEKVIWLVLQDPQHRLRFRRTFTTLRGGQLDNLSANTSDPNMPGRKPLALSRRLHQTSPDLKF